MRARHCAPPAHSSLESCPVHALSSLGRASWFATATSLATAFDKGLSLASLHPLAQTNPVTQPPGFAQAIINLVESLARAIARTSTQEGTFKRNLEQWQIPYTAAPRNALKLYINIEKATSTYPSGPPVIAPGPDPGTFATGPSPPSPTPQRPGSAFSKRRSSKRP
ncbi:hypothetical protein BJV78DRAFT_1281916 [Lactifluus subvellereus]|nr:hypothetical protein BJV78DRAFT_1281916 [Lactifluus subvellereus]